MEKVLTDLIAAKRTASPSGAIFEKKDHALGLTRPI